MLALVPTEVDRKTAGELTAELAGIGGALMAEVLERLYQTGEVRQREAAATYAPKIGKHEARLDFSRTAIEVERRVRAFNPTPGAWFEYQGERIKVLRAEILEGSGAPGTTLDAHLAIACAEGSIVPTIVQRSGKAPMRPDALLRGFPIPSGVALG
jgi:methionyl-tRNA formyltransferase